MTAVFDKLGIRFAYPEGWSLDEQELDDARMVTVSSPYSAFWWVSVHPAEVDLPHVAKAVLEGVRDNYTDIDVEAVLDQIAGRKLVGYDVNFYCLDMTSTAQLRGFQTDHGTYMMLWQAEDREFEKVKNVFRAITTSLVQTAQ